MGIRLLDFCSFCCRHTLEPHGWTIPSRSVSITSLNSCAQVSPEPKSGGEGSGVGDFNMGLDTRTTIFSYGKIF